MWHFTLIDAIVYTQRSAGILPKMINRLTDSLSPPRVSRRTLVAGAVTALTATETRATAATNGGASKNISTLQRIDRDTVITADIWALPGARFDIAAGATLALRGDLIAAASLLFTGGGKVDLNHSRVVAARPEWFGAVPDNAAVDCVPALSACLAAHPAMQLGLGDYHLGSTWVVARPNARIWGIGRTNGYRGTRLLRTGAVGTVVLVGTESPPGPINSYLRGIDMRWLELGRTVTAAVPTGDTAAAGVGLCVRHVLDCVFEGLRANEHAIGYSVRGAVRTYLRDCMAFRSTAGPSGKDVFVGFDMDGRTPPITTGANASLYLIDCNARTGGAPVLAMSVGCRLTGALSDTFVVRFETAQLAEGIRVDGRAASLDAAAGGTDFDLHIDSAILDQCTVTGIALSGLSGEALVEINSPYVAIATHGTAAISIESCGGNIGVTGGQLLASLGTGSASVGIAMRNVAGVAFTGTKLLNFPRPVEAISARGLDLVIAINNPSGTPRGVPAIKLENCQRSYVRARVTGRNTCFSSGVAADSTSSQITVETSGIDQASIAGGLMVTSGKTTAQRSGHTFFL